jgi:hypothetical protein
VGAVAERAVLTIDEGLHLPDDEPAVEVAPPALAACLVAIDGVLVVPGRGVVDPDEDQRRDAAVAGQAVGRLAGAPADAERGTGVVEDVLAVVQVQHGVALARRPLIARREVDGDRPGVPEQGGGEALVDAPLTGRVAFSRHHAVALSAGGSTAWWSRAIRPM